MLVPLFSIPSRRSWGIGEIPDLVPLSKWLESAGFDFVQFLPLNEMQEGQSSPYSALSAMAIDPVFIAVEDVDEFVVGGGDALRAKTAPRWRACARRPAWTTPSCVPSRPARSGAPLPGLPTTCGERAIAGPVAARVRGT